MTGLDQETDVCIHEWHGHRDVLAIGQNGGTICSSLFDETENVIPSGNKLGAYVRYIIIEFSCLPQLSPDEWFLNSNKISSIWNAAGRVSISTVARTVLCGMPI